MDVKGDVRDVTPGEDAGFFGGEELQAGDVSAKGAEAHRLGVRRVEAFEMQGLLHLERGVDAGGGAGLRQQTVEGGQEGCITGDLGGIVV